MELFYRRLGSGIPVVILHGLYGSSDNWMTIAKKLSDRYELILPDHRNHGQSPHSISHTYRSMVADLNELLNKLEFNKVNLIGHSMGGRVAMKFQATFPERVERMVIVDVAPWDYYPEDEWFRASYQEHMRIIEALMEMEVDKIKTRNEADKFLADKGLNSRLRSFLLKNLKRGSVGFHWALNLSVIQNNLEHLLLGVNVDRTAASKVKVMFIKGEQSNYIPKDQLVRLKEFFPNSEHVTIPKSGHWVHAEQPQLFIDHVTRFLG
ncbi:alpha/beta fold hydrolase [Tenuifilum thalassicum]|uniref:Alpha/beta fold hydrolase n=1 Tax=Tenuifilum thalassicum TaxID=2590900 RepID=A0A7D3XCD6_9BACT|nr:alpha/beta fold hydrolase [Tenuifilum thalassicum]QKG79012.1 alpha/beta fold hydrolase [Tenuifilum thalassicum]